MDDFRRKERCYRLSPCSLHCCVSRQYTIGTDFPITVPSQHLDVWDTEERTNLLHDYKSSTVGARA